MYGNIKARRATERCGKAQKVRFHVSEEQWECIISWQALQKAAPLAPRR